MRFWSIALSASIGVVNAEKIPENNFDELYGELLAVHGWSLTPDEIQVHQERLSATGVPTASTDSFRVAFLRTAPAIRAETVDRVRSTEGVLWTSSADVERFASATFSDAQRQCGSHLNSTRKAALPVVSHAAEDDPIPESFDARKDFGSECAELIGTARDQSNCGSCWSFSTTTALEDRLCLATKGKAKLLLSPLDTLSCCNGVQGCDSFGCDGGDPASAWEWFVERGVVTGADMENPSNTCKPYPFPKCAHHVNIPNLDPCSGGAEFATPTCSNKCSNANHAGSYGEDKRKAVSAYSVAPDEESIKREIMKNGPVSAAFMVYDDFLTYTGGIYHHHSGASAVGGHAVKLIGWGTEGGVKYWLLLNSWNPSWGENGAFRMKLEEGGVMNEITAGIPHLPQDDDQTLRDILEEEVLVDIQTT